MTRAWVTMLAISFVGAASDELFDHGVAACIEARCRPAPDNLAVLEHRDLVRDFARAWHVVRDRDGGALQVIHHLADQVVRASYASMWSKSFTGPFTGAATATGNSATWIGNVIAFKRTGGTP